MSIIAVKGVPFKWSLTFVVKIIKKTIKAPFEALNFQTGKNSLKICFLRLSEKIDPVRAVQAINSVPVIKSVKLTAYIPDNVPNLKLARNPKKIMHNKSRRVFVETPIQSLTKAHIELMSEMQIKYPRLYELSQKSNHDLIEDLALTVHKRLQEILDTNAEMENTFKLTMFYRRRHPHFGDFQLILSTLHRLQDAAGEPREQLLDNDLLPLQSGTLQPAAVDKSQYEQVKGASTKYANRIVKKISKHLENLDTEVKEMDTEETSARKKVREELKKLSPYVNIIIQQIFRKHFIPDRFETLRVRIYGEPFLPNKPKMVSVVSRFHPTHVVRSKRAYNLLALRVPPEQLQGLLAMDGTVISGAKLIIRSVDVPIYTKYKSVEQLLGGEIVPENDEMDDDQYEDWNIKESDEPNIIQ